MDNRYFLNLAAAFVRGTALQTGTPMFDGDLLNESLELLTDGVSPICL